MIAADLITKSQQLAGRVDQQFNSRTLQFLTEAIDNWALRFPWPSLRTTISLTADGSRDLLLPDYVGGIEWVSDMANKRNLTYQDGWESQQTSDFLSDATGSMYVWREGSVDAVYEQPSALSQIGVRCTASDTFTVHLTGIVQDTAASGTAGYEFFGEEILTISGSGPNLSTNSYVKILSLGKSAISNGDVLVTAGATQLGRIQANRYAPSYRRIELLRIPPAGTQLRVGALLLPQPLTSTNQAPHHTIDRQYLIWYAAGLILKAQNEPAKGDAMVARAEEILAAKAYKERAHGAKDWICRPDDEYWQSEDRYAL